MTKKAFNKMKKLEKIVEEHQCTEVQGVLVDASTACVCLKVYTALNETNKAKFVELPMDQMGQLAWKLVS